MALKFKTKEEIPAEHLPLYAERDGAWLLDVDGAVEKAMLDEFRITNVLLLKERDELKKRFEGIDPDEVRKLADEKRRLEEGAQLKASEVEKVVEARVKSLKGDSEKQLFAATTERDALNARLAANHLAKVISDESFCVQATQNDKVCRPHSLCGHGEGSIQSLEREGLL